MKKLFTVFIIFLGLIVVSAEEQCNSFYKVSLNIEGKGTVKTKLSDKEYKTDSTINVQCADSFLFQVEPDDGYILDGVFINGNNITKDDYDNYGLYDILANANIKVLFRKTKEYPENELLFSSSDNSISLYISDIKSDVKDNTVLRLFIKEVEIALDKNFIQNSGDNITVVADQLYKDDLNYKEQKAAPNALYYDFSLYEGENKINSFGDITLNILYSDSKKAYVYKVNKDGKLNFIDSKRDEESITFDIKESGLYAISKEELDEMGYIKNFLNLNNQKAVAIIGCGFAISLLILLLIIKKRK